VATKKPAAKKLRVAVIGAGNMGRNHIRTYSNLNENAELVALADVNPQAEALAKEYGVKFYTDYKEMLDKENLDAVSIVVPTPLHHAFATEVMQRGIHCLVEKPIASTPEEGQELMELAEAKNVIFTVGHIERYNPMIRKLKKLIDDKEIGDITSIAVRRVGGFPAIEPKTDVIIDLAVHDIEIISHLLDKQPTKIYGHGSRTLHSSKIDSAEIFMDYGSASGYVQANWITPIKIRTIAVTGTDGYVEGNYINQELVHYQHNMKRQRAENFKDFLSAVGEPEKRHIMDTPQEPLANELKAFINAIHSMDASDLVHPKAAQQALRIALKAIEPESQAA
jgi:UDP-N-acetylglucosamine 3-dehydrogenase